jgi:sugar phosphate permease
MAIDKEIPADDNRVVMPAAVAQRVAVVTVVILFFAWLIDYIDRLVITLALPAIGTQFSLDKTAQGAILTAFFITYALFQVPGGLLADRIGSRQTMVIAMTLWSAFTALTGAAMSYLMLIVVRLFFGVFEGIFPGASVKAISERTTRQIRMTCNGVMLASNPLGAAVSPLIAAPAIALVGWRHAFFYVAGVGIVMAAIVWFALPRVLPRAVTKPATAHDEPPTQMQSLTGHGLRLLTSGTMWKFTLMFFGFDIVAWGLVSWVPSYLVVQKHLTLISTGVLASIPWFAATLSTALGGWVFDRYLHNRQRWLIVPCMIITAGLLYLMLSSSTTGRFILFETIGMFVMFLAFMPIFGLPVRLLPAEVVGSGSALVNFGGQAGGAIAPLVMGVLADNVGFGAAFGFLVFRAALAAAAALWSPQSAEEFERALRKVLGRQQPRQVGQAALG